MDVIAAAAELLGVAPLRVRPTGNGNTFFVDLTDRRTVVVKFATRERSVLAEAWAYRLASAQGVRVPSVLATRSDPEAIAVELMPGDSLWSAERRDKDNATVWQHAGEDLRALHEIQVPGFGPLAPSDRGFRGRADSWCPFVRYAREKGIRKLVDASALDGWTSVRLERRYDEAARELHECDDGRLLHGDLEGGHIFVVDESYQGIIDFDQAQVGDPRWDLARIPLWDGEGCLDDVLDGYGRDVIETADRDLLLPLYLLAFVIHHAVRLTEEGQLSSARGHLAQTQYERLL